MVSKMLDIEIRIKYVVFQHLHESQQTLDASCQLGTKNSYILKLRDINNYLLTNVVLSFDPILSGLQLFLIWKYKNDTSNNIQIDCN